MPHCLFPRLVFLSYLFVVKGSGEEAADSPTATAQVLLLARLPNEVT
jgi:hypothetical protein